MAKIREQGYLIAGVNAGPAQLRLPEPEHREHRGLRDRPRERGGQGDLRHRQGPRAARRADRAAAGFTAVEQGKVDIVVDAITMTCARRTAGRLLDGLLRRQAAAAGAVELAGVKSIGASRGKRVCATAGSTPIDVMERDALPPSARSPSASLRRSIASWLCSRAGSPGSPPTPRSCSASRRRIPNTKIVGPSLADVPYGMEISKAHPDFVRFVNGVLAKLEQRRDVAAALHEVARRHHPRSDPGPSHGCSTTVEMSRDDPTHELARLQEASDRVAANLVELEIDSSRQLLEVSTLTGRSADRWSQASAALTDLWRWQGQLEQLLERAEKLRGPWRANELRSLLDGESIELTRSEVPLAERDLLGSSEITVRCTAPGAARAHVRGVRRGQDGRGAVRRRLERADAARDRRADGRSTRRRRSRPGSANATGATSTRRRAQWRTPRDVGERRPALDRARRPRPGDRLAARDPPRPRRDGRAPARVRRAGRRRPRPAGEPRDDGRRGPGRAR